MSNPFRTWQDYNRAVVAIANRIMQTPPRLRSGAEHRERERRIKELDAECLARLGVDSSGNVPPPLCPDCGEAVLANRPNQHAQCDFTKKETR